MIDYVSLFVSTSLLYIKYLPNVMRREETGSGGLPYSSHGIYRCGLWADHFSVPDNVDEVDKVKPQNH